MSKRKFYKYIEILNDKNEVIDSIYLTTYESISKYLHAQHKELYEKNNLTALTLRKIYTDKVGPPGSKYIRISVKNKADIPKNSVILRTIIQ